MIASLAGALLQGVLLVPGPVRLDLEASCARWRLAPVMVEVDAEIRSRTPDWPANFIRGDFDGNGQADVAILAECPHNRGSTVQVFAFLADGAAFTKFALEKPAPPDAREFLHLIPRGVQNGYELDAIGVEFEAVGGHAWVYRDGKWQSIARP